MIMIASTFAFRSSSKVTTVTQLSRRYFYRLLQEKPLSSEKRSPLSPLYLTTLALPPAWTARDGAYQRPEGSPSSIILLALLPLLHQFSCLRYARSRGLGFDAGECSAAEALLLRWSLRLSVALASRMRGWWWLFSPSSSGRVALLLRVNGGSPLQIQEVVRLGIEFWGSRCFVELRLSPYWRGVCRWILLPRRRVVGLSTQSGWCSSSVAGSRKV
ncbi:hypothetical protein YC2023_091134 [Brassica napus]